MLKHFMTRKINSLGVFGAARLILPYLLADREIPNFLQLQNLVSMLKDRLTRTKYKP
jgi:hypothetical protein